MKNKFKKKQHEHKRVFKNINFHLYWVATRFFKVFLGLLYFFQVIICTFFCYFFTLKLILNLKTVLNSIKH